MKKKNNEKQAEMLADFIMFLRMQKNTNPSDTELVYSISAFLEIPFQEANKAVTDALNVVEKAVEYLKKDNFLPKEDYVLPEKLTVEPIPPTGPYEEYVNKEYKK